MTLRTFVYRAYTEFLKPRATDEDSARRERILTLVLAGIIALTTTGVLCMLWQSIFAEKHPVEIPFFLLIGIDVFFISLYIGCRKGYSKYCGYIFVGVFLLLSFAESAIWGASMPMGLLSYALAITMGSIVIDTKTGLIVTFLAILGVLVTGVHEAASDTIPAWKQFPLVLNDVIEYSVMLSVTSLLSWLSNRELERSLSRTRASEKTLAYERDNLEILVLERTRKLQETEYERMVELTRFAEFGKLSAGLFHDLMNPLTAVSLSVEGLESMDTNTLRIETKEVVNRAVQATKRMERYVAAIRTQIKSDDSNSNFSVVAAIHETVELLHHRAAKLNITIVYREPKAPILLFGNTFKFSQIMNNLIANALDAYEYSNTSAAREVTITTRMKGAEIEITVADHAGGIPSSVLPKIFTPFFTTKEKGIGLGLATVKEIVEQVFNGTITIASMPGKDTVFTILIPPAHNNLH